MTDDDTPKLTDDDLKLWQQTMGDVAEGASSKKPNPKMKRVIETIVDDLADDLASSPSYPPYDLDQFERYIDGSASEKPLKETPNETQYIQTVHFETTADGAAFPAPKPHTSDPFTVLEHTADLIAGTRGGVDSRTLKKLASGQIRPTRRLDLHGHYLLDAYQAIRAFVEQSQQQEHKCVLIIHGKGKGAHREMGVIKQNISQFLADISAVLAFHTALPRDGGSGACYVLLKRKK